MLIRRSQVILSVAVGLVAVSTLILSKDAQNLTTEDYYIF
jgi:hypothetical protein